jgi:tetratricopeptide (TPR) repeat protein
VLGAEAPPLPPPAPKSAAPAAERPALPQDPAPLIAQLGSDSATARDEALEALIALGDAAVPALTAATKHADPEVAWRTRAALHRIRWRISRKLAERIADLMDDFESQPVGRRELVCRDLVMVGITESVPTLQQVLKTDPSTAVRHAAARALIVLGDRGLAALLEAGVKTEGLSVYTVSVRVHLGNSHLERGELEKALEQYRIALELDPKNSIVHYNLACTHARMKKIDLAIEALQRAIACGYRDADWMEKDTDLENLRDDPRFKTLLRKIREEEKREEE